MSIITEKEIERELLRLFKKARPDDVPQVVVNELLPARVKFWLRIGEETIEIGASPDALMGPMDYFSSLYLKKIVNRLIRKNAV
jgi:hypothetical protein